MADTDPFVKRMLARSEARRAMLAKLGEDSKVASKPLLDKENLPQKSSEVLRECKHKGSLNKDNAAQPLAEKSTPEQKNQNVEDSSPPALSMPSSPVKSQLKPSKQLDVASSESSNSSFVPKSSTNSNTLVQMDSTLGEQRSQDSVPSPPCAARKGLRALARRQQQMQEWEDDYSYHSASAGSKVSSKTGSKTFNILHGATSTVETNLISSKVLDSAIKITKPVTTSTADSNPILSKASDSTTELYGPLASTTPSTNLSLSKASDSAVKLSKPTTRTEDDQVHPSSSALVSPPPPPPPPPPPHTRAALSTNVHAVNNNACRTNLSNANMHATSSKESPTKTSSPKKPSANIPVYHYGEKPLLSPGQKQIIELKLHKPKVACTDLDQASAASTKVLPTAGPASNNRDRSPASKLFWDRKLISSLEAQGFTPESQSRLVYQFKKEQEELRREQQATSPSKSDVQPTTSQSCSAPEASTTETKVSNACITLEAGDPAPKILSCVLKPTSGSSAVSAGQSPRSSRTRAASPTSVEQLRNRWEQQIRDRSPERQHTRARSCSPTKPPRTCVRSGSPSKPGDGHLNRPNLGGSIAHKTQFINNVQPHHVSRDWSLSPAKTLGVTSASSAGVPTSRASHRSRSPLKQSVSAGTVTREIVKGVCPMPDAVPLLDEPHQSTVKARAAAFSSVMTAPAEACPKKDPAELSVQGRRQIFERRGEDALLPKAPFGQPVPAKVLQSTTAGVQHGATQPPSAAQRQASSGGNVPPPSGGVVLRYRGALEAAAASEGASVDDAWQQQKRREMEALRNRFTAAPPAYTAPAADGGDDYTDSEYAESEFSFEKSETASCAASEQFSPGPPKPPRTYADPLPPYSSPMPPPPPPPSDSCRKSPGKRNFEPHVKPGCLYPGLSDIESMSDVEHQQNESACSSESAGDATCVSMDSLGTKIQKIAQRNREQQQQPMHVVQEDEETESVEACSDTSAALEEAFSDDSGSNVTPPKRHRDEQSEAEAPHSHYKTPRISTSPGRPAASGGQTPLTHTISMYRKQRPAEVSYTPVRQVIQRPEAGEITSPVASATQSPPLAASERIRILTEMENKELRIMQQACGAVAVAEQRPDQLGDTHHIEAEKLLLLSTHRRAALLAEIQLVKQEVSMVNCTADPDVSVGCVTFSNITLPLSQDFLKRGINEVNHHVLVLAKQREKVLATCVQSTPGCVVNGAITFPSTLTLDDLRPNFSIDIEVYVFRLPASAGSAHSHLKKDQSRMKLMPLKRLQQQQQRGSPSSSAASPGAVTRSSVFTLMGAITMRISALSRSAWDLQKVPPVSPFSGHLLMQVQVRAEGGVSGRGFLTVFQDVGGLGAWTRRWAVLDGPALKFWNYPDQENKQKCVQFVALRLVSTRHVELVSRDVCARPHTFLVTTVRPTEAGDTNSLVTEVAANTTITKLLLSADSSEERVEWCRKLNVALANIRAWDPHATRPQPYEV